MYNNWQVDNTASVRAFENIQHTVIPKMIAGKILRVEKQDNEVLIIIDQYSGIDYLRKDATGLQGIAWRAQWGGKAWDTFTIRYARHSGVETEYEKRVRQIDQGYLYPAFTMQGYFDDRENNNPLSLGVVRTQYLYQFIKDCPDRVHKNRSDNDFVFVRWEDLDEARVWHAA